MTGTLVLLRHGQSSANAGGLFTGLLDAALTDEGRREAENAARLLDEAGLLPPLWYCSPLLRARQTAQIVEERLAADAHVGIVEDWRLAERNYGALTGLGKASVVAEHGEETVRAWRRSVDVAPPPMTREQREALGPAPEWLGLTESLRDVIGRVGPLWSERIRPGLDAAGSAMVIAHGNSLRALCAVLDGLSDDEVRELNIPTGHPLVYRIGPDDRPLVRGGSYLDSAAATAAAAVIAHEGGT